MRDKEKFGPSETVIKAQKGDSEAISQLLSDYRPMLLRAVSASAPGLSDAGYTREDLMQEASVALSAAIGTYDGGKGVTFGAYARRCVRNRLISVARSAKRMRRTDVPVPEKKEEPLLPAASLEAVERSLTAYERSVFRLLCTGYKPAEIAARLERPVKSVYNAVCRIKAKAKEQKESMLR